jgi:CYTH domain-containing protein
LKELPPDVTGERMIVDHYWIGTSLRLRVIQDGDEVIYKLCQKVRREPDDPESVMITNIYLSGEEFHALSVMPSNIVTKSRWSATFDDVRYAVDEFKGRHVGLVLAELELREDEPLSRGPAFAVADVTNADEYSGGWLAMASSTDLERIMLPARTV